MRLTYHFRELKLKHPFSISRHTYYSQPSFCVRLSAGGVTGYGEATTNPYYNITKKNLAGAFESIKTVLERYKFEHPDVLWSILRPLLDDNYFALSAINNASWDLYGKLEGKSVASLLQIHDGEKPMTSFTIGIDKPEVMLEKMNELPWPVYKIKVGMNNDIEVLEAIRRDTDAIIRVDANGGWTAKQTRSYGEILARLNIEFVEQPLPAKDLKEMRSLYEFMPMPLIADENCVREEDVLKCSGNFHGINIKLQKCGGITPALRMIREARSLGMKIMLGCMTESTVGISAAVPLMSMADYVDLDGPLIIDEDPAEGLEFANGFIFGSRHPGLGFRIKKQNMGKSEND